MAGFLYVIETYNPGAEDLPVAAQVKVTVASRPETHIDFTTDTMPYAVSAKVYALNPL